MFLLGGVTARGEEARVQQAREAGRLETTRNEPDSPEARLSMQAPDVRDDGSFGVQQLLGEGSKAQNLTAFTDVSGQVTSNVALTRHDAKSDAFLVATFGLNYRRALGGGVRLEADASFSTFRYNHYPSLGFNDLEAGLGLSYTARFLGGVDLYAGYAYSNLTTRSSDTFFENHALLLNAQKSWPLGRAQSLLMGLAAELALADPRRSQRSEYSAYAGYRLAATRRLDLRLLYRYAYYDFAEGGRGDHNSTISLGGRYRFSERFSADALSYVVINRSNQSEFNYQAGTLGAGFTLSYTF